MQKVVFSGVLANLDRVLALLALAGSVALIPILRADHQVFPVVPTVFGASALYLLAGRRLQPRLARAPDGLPLNSRIRAAIWLTLYTLLAVAFLSLVFRDEQYARPATYFIATSLAAGLLAGIIVSGPRSPSYHATALLTIILVGLALRLIPQCMFPDLVGIDPWRDRYLTTAIVRSGHVPTAFSYSKLPAMHIIVAQAAILTGLDYRWAAMLAVSLSQAASLSFVWFAGKVLYNPRAGLLAALMLAFFPNYVRLGFWVIPTTWALILSIVILFLLVKQTQGTAPGRLTALKMVVGFAIIITHTQVALAVCLVLFSFRLGVAIFRRVRRCAALYRPPSYDFAVLFTVAMFSWWAYVSGHLSLFANLLRRAGYIEGNFQSMSVYAGGVPYAENFLNLSPFLMFYGLAVLGSLLAASAAMRTPSAFGVAFAGWTLALVPFALLPTELGGYLYERWFYDSQVLLSFAAGAGLLALCGLLGSVRRALLLASALVSGFVFVSLVSPSANMDFRSLNPNSIARQVLTESELQATDTLSRIYHGPILTDFVAAQPFNFPRSQSDQVAPQHGSRAKDIRPALAQRTVRTLDGLCLIREDLVVHPFNYGTIMTLGYDPRAELTNHGFNGIYDAGTSAAFAPAALEESPVR